MAQHPEPEADTFRWDRLLPALLIAAAALAYINPYQSVLTVPFLFDDEPWVEMVAHEVDGGPGAVLANFAHNRRAMVILTMAINYWIDGESPAGYHLFNVIVHVLAGLALFGVMRRTLLLPRVRDRAGPVATGLAFAVALVWLLHPLASQAVIYVVQRAESMMATFFLASLYCAIRLLDDKAARAVWLPLMTVAALLGMWCKEVMAVLPIVVVLYDRVFTDWSLREQVARRWAVYVLLAATWSVLLLGGLVTQLTMTDGSAGLAAQFTTPWQYAITQPKIIFHYLYLSLWPGPLAFDYGWAPAVQPYWERDLIVKRLITEVLPWSAALLAIVVACAVAWWRRWWWGFAGLAFFCILSPTSSFVPIADLAVEHRMYLPLAVVCAVVVVLLYVALRAALRGVSVGVMHTVAVVLLIGVSAAFFIRTTVRTADYQSAERIWFVTMHTRPYNPRPSHHYGLLLVRSGRFEEGIRYLDEALELAPDRAGVLNDLANVFVRQGMYDRAADYFAQALAKTPDDATIHFNIAEMHAQQQHWPQAIASLNRAIELRPDYAKARNNLGRVYWALGEQDRALEEFRLAIQYDPLLDDAYVNVSLFQQGEGDLSAALATIDEGLARVRRGAGLWARRGQVLVAMGRQTEALDAFDQALKRDPANEQAYLGVAGLCVETGQFDKARLVLAEALQQGTAMPRAERQWASLTVADAQAPRDHLEQAYAIAKSARDAAADKDLPAWVLFAQAAARIGRHDEAIAALDTAIAMRTAQPDSTGPSLDALRALRAEFDAHRDE